MRRLVPDLLKGDGFPVFLERREEKGGSRRPQFNIINPDSSQM